MQIDFPARLSCWRVDAAVNHGVSRRVASQRKEPEAKQPRRTSAVMKRNTPNAQKHLSQSVWINIKLFVSTPAPFVNEDATSCWPCCCRKLANGSFRRGRRKFMAAVCSIFKDFPSERQSVCLSCVREEAEGWKSVNVPRFVLLEVGWLDVSSVAVEL